MIRGGLLSHQSDRLYFPKIAICMWIDGTCSLSWTWAGTYICPEHWGTVSVMLCDFLFLFSLKELFYCGKNTWHEIYPLNKFWSVKCSIGDYSYNYVQQISRTSLSCLIETSCPLISNHPFPPSLDPWKPPLPLLIIRIWLFYIPCISRIYSSVAGVFHLVWWPQGLSMLSHIVEFPSLSLLYSILLYVHTTFSVAVQPLINI